MRVTVLASGSSGNAILVTGTSAAGECTRVLVDAGIGPRALERALAAASEGAPHAIVVTHAHADHVGEAARIARRLAIPIFCTAPVARDLDLPTTIAQRVFDPREPFAFGALTIEPCPVPHDSANVALRLGDGRAAVAIATDVGEPTGRLLELLRGAEIVLLESNYDDALLACGPYPPSVRARVSSSKGHLSNRQAHEILRRLDARTESVVLVHLSESNNDAAIALESARDALPLSTVVTVARGRDRVVVEPLAHRFRGRGAVQLALPLLSVV